MNNREATSLELTRWEADALQRFCTARRLHAAAIDPVRQCLPPHQDEPTGRRARAIRRRQGESGTYRALIAQLAVVTGAQDASQQYFSVLEALEEDEPLAKVIAKLGVPIFF